MKIGLINGATRHLGADQGYLGLPIRDAVIHDSVNGPETPCMVSAWYPSPEQLVSLIKGSPILLTVLGTVHPPVSVDVGETGEARPIPDPAPVAPDVDSSLLMRAVNALCARYGEPAPHPSATMDIVVNGMEQVLRSVTIRPPVAGCGDDVTAEAPTTAPAYGETRFRNTIEKLD